MPLGPLVGSLNNWIVPPLFNPNPATREIELKHDHKNKNKFHGISFLIPYCFL